MRRVRLRDGMPIAEYNLWVQQNITEDTWQQQVENRCHECGWKAVHIRRGKVPIKANQPATERERQEGMRWLTPVSEDGAGWPDLIVVKELTPLRSALIAWELKTFGKRATGDQLWWLDFFRHLPGCVDASVRFPWELDKMTVLLNRD